MQTVQQQYDIMEETLAKAITWNATAFNATKEALNKAISAAVKAYSADLVQSSTTRQLASKALTSTLTGTVLSLISKQTASIIQNDSMRSSRPTKATSFTSASLPSKNGAPTTASASFQTQSKSLNSSKPTALTSSKTSVSSSATFLRDGCHGSA